MEEYRLIFGNQSIGNDVKYTLIRETVMYVFLKKEHNPIHIFRVHKKSLNVKGIKQGKNGYKWNLPKAIILEKIS
jgi:hypothetical protein